MRYPMSGNQHEIVASPESITCNLPTARHALPFHPSNLEELPDEDPGQPGSTYGLALYTARRNTSKSRNHGKSESLACVSSGNGMGRNDSSRVGAISDADVQATAASNPDAARLGDLGAAGSRRHPWVRGARLDARPCRSARAGARLGDAQAGPAFWLIIVASRRRDRGCAGFDRRYLPGLSARGPLTLRRADRESL